MRGVRKGVMRGEKRDVRKAKLTCGHSGTLGMPVE
jgi:hypothetical protein